MISTTSAKTEEFRDKIILSRIKKYGWAKIICPAASDSPAFAFTVGLFKKWKHPEVIVFGLEVAELAGCLESIASRVAAGEVFKPLHVVEGVLSAPCIFTEADFQKNEWFGYAQWYYQSDFPTLQCVWSDAHGYFPWHPECDQRVFNRQIMLSRDARMHRWVEEKYYPKEPEASTIVRRYLTADKFERLLHDSAIYFRNATLFTDKFEGSIAKNLHDFYVNTLTDWQEKWPQHEGAAKVLEYIRKRRHLARLAASYVNCWFAGTHESSGMWATYSQSSDAGVAIESTYGRLLHAFESDLPVEHGMVQYVDFAGGSFDSPKLRYEFSEQPLMFKRVEYQDEHELRLIVIRPDENEAHLATEDEKLIKPEHDGINLPIDLATLLSRVIVGPGTPNATIEGIKQKIANHGIGIPVCKSVLDAVPLF